MKYVKILPFVLIGALAACNDSSDTASATNDSTAAAKTADTPANEMKVMIPNTACYASFEGKDSITLKVERFPNVVTGQLQYKIFEKDSNKGDIDGVLHGDTLIADYKFKSEGKESVRQVAFLIKDSTAVEGYGDIEDKGGKMVFKDISTIKFGTGIKLKMRPCPEQ